MLTMKKYLFIIFLMLPGILYSQSVGVKVNAGSLGIGPEVLVRVHENVNARAGINFFSFSTSIETKDSSEFDFDGDLSLFNANLLVDFHPFGNSFRLTGGLLYNSNKVETVLIPKKSYNIGGDVYTSAELGVVMADIEFKPISPYLALGFGNVFTGGRFGFGMDFGVLYQQSPKVSMSAEGLLAPSAGQADQLQDNLSWAEWYPVLTLSLTYRIN
jgi:hypothetical protein